MDGVGFVPGFVDICVRERWYCAVEESTNAVTEGNGSGGLAYIDGIDVGNVLSSCRR